VTEGEVGGGVVGDVEIGALLENGGGVMLAGKD
jgi:hypothetical protein